MRFYGNQACVVACSLSIGVLEPSGWNGNPSTAISMGGRHLPDQRRHTENFDLADRMITDDCVFTLRKRMRAYRNADGRLRDILQSAVDCAVPHSNLFHHALLSFMSESLVFELILPT
jgi:hypothetical protein